MGDYAITSDETQNNDDNKQCFVSAAHLQISRSNHSRVSYTSSTCSTTIELNHQKHNKPENVTEKTGNTKSTCFTLCILKLRSRVFWVVLMAVLGTFYMLINLMNYYQLTKHEHELVIGPPHHIMVILLAAFTLVGVVICFFELANTLSVFFRGGYPLISLTIEMVVTILLVHVPMAGINYFIARCRAMHSSMWQILSGVFSIVFIFIRILWFAHMQGAKLKQNDKREMRQGLFMAVCALFSCAIAFQILSWSNSLVSQLTDDHTHNVSILLLDIPNKRNRRLENMNLTRMPEFPALHKKTLQEIIHANSSGIQAAYRCPHNTNQSMPLECMQLYDDTEDLVGANLPIALLFRIVHNRIGSEPFGEILFNYAIVYENSTVVSALTGSSDPYNEHGNSDILPTGSDLYKNHGDSIVYTPATGSDNLHGNSDSNNSDNSVDKTSNSSSSNIGTGTAVYNGINIIMEAKLQEKKQPATRRKLNLRPRHLCSSDSVLIRESSSAMGGDWYLWYVTLGKGGGLVVNSPWTDSCSTPHPKYSRKVNVC